MIRGAAVLAQVPASACSQRCNYRFNMFLGCPSFALLSSRPSFSCLPYNSFPPCLCTPPPLVTNATRSLVEHDGWHDPRSDAYHSEGCEQP